MKVSKLIEELQALDKDADVYINAYEGGFERLEIINPNRTLELVNDGSDWDLGVYGNYDQVDDDIAKATYNKPNGVILQRRTW